ncbi:PAAR domain-containing protein [Stenotrophomonas sp. SI-NJAU-1]|uniref:PAAR domain-containing protein n=1 Tax=Stenotrophomonas TaxID=40323 RepID=UPI000E3C9865|nr:MULTISPECIES: PAAR domain-containing protein [unclassified Stenotrophomonas]MBO1748393.1 PAAR domain-containing protein [Stenotrophomonas indicatrix]UEX16991.1 PAAR domain-containing protein [Stenotrophomonas sp. SI-NJAU-1]
MARTLIVVGDATTGGGRVITGSPTTDIEGKPVARVGDKATCPRHQVVASIVSGDSTLMFEGQPVARDGDRLSCGCSLIAGQQSLVFVDAGGGGGGADSGPAAQAVQAASGVAPAALVPAVPMADKAPVCEACLLAGAHSGATFLGR